MENGPLNLDQAGSVYLQVYKGEAYSFSEYLDMDLFKCDELASRTSKDLNFFLFPSSPFTQNLDKNQNLDKQINSFHIRIPFCYQLTFKM